MKTALRVHCRCMREGWIRITLNVLSALSGLHSLFGLESWGLYWELLPSFMWAGNCYISNSNANSGAPDCLGMCVA